MKGYKLIISDANAMYTNINIDHAIVILQNWFDLHKNELLNDFNTDLVLRLFLQKTVQPWEQI